MNGVLWTLQVLLACAFSVVGLMHGSAPWATLATKMAWVADAPRWLPRFIGVVEVLGALGLILPAATHIAPWLTPLAAGGLAAMMLMAALMHLVRAEVANGLPSVVLLLLCCLVAWGRAREG